MLSPHARFRILCFTVSWIIVMKRKGEEHFWIAAMLPTFRAVIMNHLRPTVSDATVASSSVVRSTAILL
jgi:hypothetical protein